MNVANARKLPLIWVIALALFWLAAQPAFAENTFPHISIEITTPNAETHTFDTELAHLPALRQQGLMGRAHLSDNQAMLFTWPVSARRTFWMKNTPLSLDILFFDEDRQLVHYHLNTSAFSEELLSSLQPIAYAVEIKAGRAEALGIEKLSTLKLPANLPQAE